VIADESVDTPAPHDARSPLDLLVVLNPVAARSESAEARTIIEAAIETRGLHARIVETIAGAGAQESVNLEIGRALEGGCRRIVAVGGDGTITLAASVLMRPPWQDSTAVLAIVPTGTANVLARELGIPLALDAAVALAFDGEESIELDAIRAGDRLVLTQVGIGLDARMIRSTSREDRIQKGRRAYLLALVRQAIGQRAVAFDLEIDGNARRVHAWQIIVANTGTLGAAPFTWGPGIDPTDGALDLVIYSARTVLDYGLLIARMLTGRHHRDSRTQYLRVERRLVVRSRRPVLVQGDGELLGHTPITLEVVPHVLRVCVPKNVEDMQPMVGSPNDPTPRTAKTLAEEQAAVPGPAETLQQDVDTMVAQHSRTWVLQGWPGHPIAFLSALDAALYLRINALQFGPLADRVLVLLSSVMHYGEGWALVALVMLITDFRTGLRASMEALPVLWLMMLTVNYPLKRMFRRHRPFIAFVDARVLGPKPRDYSFPSGHSAAAFAGAFLFGAHAPAWSPLFYVLATAVGFSRVYLGVHYPSDVVIGAIFGASLAGAFLALFRMVVTFGS
jgi:diacylglycerol kinase family enzyme/membrane-associated phospholipid phosphatase